MQRSFTIAAVRFGLASVNTNILKTLSIYNTQHCIKWMPSPIPWLYFISRYFFIVNLNIWFASVRWVCLCFIQTTWMRMPNKFAAHNPNGKKFQNCRPNWPLIVVGHGTPHCVKSHEQVRSMVSIHRAGTIDLVIKSGNWFIWAWAERRTICTHLFEFVIWKRKPQAFAKRL